MDDAIFDSHEGQGISLSYDDVHRGPEVHSPSYLVYIWDLTLQKKRSEREVDFSNPYNAELQDEGFTATPPVDFHDGEGKI